MRYARIASVFGLVLSVGCAGSGQQDSRTAADMQLPAERPELSDAQFAAAAKSALTHMPETPEQLGLLVSVVRHQLRRAEAMFEAGHPEAGLRAVVGALHFVRKGELRPEMVAGRSAALKYAVAEVARLGREGQSRAFYSLLLTQLPPGPDRDNVQGHLQALDAWEQDASGVGEMTRAGAIQRATAQRASLEPSQATFDDAVKATQAWIRLALRQRSDGAPPQSLDEREEAIEAFRAIRSGALALTALHVRHGDAAGALQSLDAPGIAKIVSPNLRDELVVAGEDDSAESWATLFSLFESLRSGGEGQASVEGELAEGAMWGAAIQLFRTERGSVRAAVPLSTLLMHHEMAEVAPLLFEEALLENKNPSEINWALEYVFESVNRAASIDDIGAVRRIFGNSHNILDLARGSEFAQKLDPSPGQLDFLMGAIEARNGHLSEARPHLVRAISAQPTAEALSLLAAIDRQRGEAASAIKSLQGVIELNKQQRDTAAEAEARLLHFEIQRDAGNASLAQAELETALKLSLEARKQARTLREQAYAERILARTLEHYGELQAANRASERALEASRGSSRQLAATILDNARRALTRGDVKSAREAVRQGIEENLASEDLVYATLWLMLLEQRSKVTSDGTVDEALAQLELSGGWPATLKAWAKGDLSNEELLEGAHNPVERVEAQFYVTMATIHNDEQLNNELKQIATSEAIQLVEVTIARDLTTEAKASPALPSDVSIP